MPTSLDSKDLRFYATREILTFSENWKSLYQPYPWPNPPPKEEENSSNTRTKSCINADCEGRLVSQPPAGGDSHYFITSNFIPNNHSTPNVKVNQKQTDGGGSKHSASRGSSIEAMSFSTTYPDTSRSVDRGGCLDNSYTSAQHCGGGGFDEIGVGVVPSISRDLDAGCNRHKYTCKEIYCDRNRNRRLRKTGIKGVRCIVSFALTDDPVKKRTQIQACSISVMILAIVSISFVLVYFTSNKYNITTDAVPIAPSNMTLETVRATTSTVRLPVIQSLTNELALGPVSTTEPFGDSAISEKNFAISQIIVKIQKNLRSFPRRSEPSNLASNDTASAAGGGIAIGNDSRDVSMEFCKKCQKGVEVCMLNEESGIPVCINAVDRHDPTGCGGVCALDTEACQMVDRARGVRVCRALSSLRCTQQQWRCQNGLCVSSASRCDGRIDCYDKSDEMHCDCDLSKHFRCGHSTSCFPNSKLCDGTVDCWDGHDEFNCTNSCPDNEFTCTNGQCIAQVRFCDGFADCADSSDEPRGCDAACGARELRCANARCVPRAARCDGVDNCGDRSDELHCS